MRSGGDDSLIGGFADEQLEPNMNTYQTLRQAIGVARTLSRSAVCTIVVYKVEDNKFITARPEDAVTGLIMGVYRNGYVLGTAVETS